MRDSEFEGNASGLLGELYEVDHDRSHKLLTRPLTTWNGTSVFELANSATLMDFTKHDYCQTKLDKMWHGKLAAYTKWWKVCLRIICLLNCHL